jgi:hypothetical protein
MCSLYVAGLIGPGERKSLQPIAARAAMADYDHVHHFEVAAVAAGAFLQANELAKLRQQYQGLYGPVIDPVIAVDEGVAKGDDLRMRVPLEPGWLSDRANPVRNNGGQII